MRHPQGRARSPARAAGRSASTAISGRAAFLRAADLDRAPAARHRDQKTIHRFPTTAKVVPTLRRRDLPMVTDRARTATIAKSTKSTPRSQLKRELSTSDRGRDLAQAGWPVRVQATRLGERRSQRIERLHRHDRIEQRVQRRRAAGGYLRPPRSPPRRHARCRRARPRTPPRPDRPDRRAPAPAQESPWSITGTRSVVHSPRQRLGMQAAGLLQLQSPFVNDAEAQTAADHVQAACRHEQRHGRRPVAGERSLEPLRQSLEGCGQRSSSWRHTATSCARQARSR